MTRLSLLRYIVAVASVAAALALTLSLWQFMEPNRFLLLAAAVMFTAWYGGLLPGLLAALLAIIGDLTVLPPAFPTPNRIGDILRLGMFVLVSVMMGSLSAARRRAQEALRKAHGELELKVRERTVELEQTAEELRAEVVERKRAEEELEKRVRQQAVVAELGGRALSGVGLDELMNECAARVAETLEVEYCKVLELLPGGESLSLRAGFGWGEGSVRNAAVDAGLNSCGGFTLHSKQPVIVEDLRTETRFNPPPLLQQHGVVSGVSVLVQDHERPFGILGAHTTRRRKFTPNDVHFLQAISGVLGAAIERKRLEEEHARFVGEQAARAEAEAALRRSAFLAEASGVLASSLDYRTTLKNVARLAVPNFADYCVLDIFDEDGELRRAEVAHSDREKDELVRRLRKYPPDLDNPLSPVAKVLRSGKMEVYREFPDTLLEGSAADEEHLRLLRELAPKSSVIAPLLARERTLGAITFTFAESGRRHTPVEEALIRDLVGRAALAVDNARLYAELQEANRARDEFLATASHELRTPLASMLIWTRMLTSGKLDSETTAHALKTLVSNVKSLSQLINDLLDVSRIITGKLRIDARPTELAPVVEEAVEVVRPASDAKGIEVRTEFDATAGPVLGDPDRLRQVVWNLASNAIKFTPAGGSVKVRVGRVGSSAYVSVSDTGCGIDAKTLPHIFERFYQSDDKNMHGGMGLGLAIVRHLVEMHGGTVSAESPGEGLGATFTVKIPLVAVLPEEDDREVMRPDIGKEASFICPVSLEGLSVLVVDDEAATREVVRAVLEHCGARVTEAASCAEAVDVFAAKGSDERPDVIVSDIQMPGEDGYALIRRVRALDAGRGGQVPAVALTARAGEEDRVRALAAGFQSHMSKPVEPTELVAVVASLAGHTGKGQSGG